MNLPVADLSSPEEKLMHQMFSAITDFECNRIRERTNESLARAISEGKKIVRSVVTNTIKTVQDAKARGLSTTTVKQYWNKTTT